MGSYLDMCKAAIKALLDRNGSSGVDIKKIILTTNPDVKFARHSLRHALKKGVESGNFVKVKSSFKLSAGEKNRVVKKKKPKRLNLIISLDRQRADRWTKGGEASLSSNNLGISNHLPAWMSNSPGFHISKQAEYRKRSRNTHDQTQVTPKKAKSSPKQMSNSQKRKGQTKKQTPMSKKQKMIAQKRKGQTKELNKKREGFDRAQKEEREEKKRSKRAALVSDEARGHSGGLRANLADWLESMNLEKFHAGIVEMGATTVSEVVNLEPADLNCLGLKELEKRRLWRNVLNVRKGIKTHPDDVVNPSDVDGKVNRIHHRSRTQTCSGPDDFSKDAKMRELSEEVHELKTKNDGLSHEMWREKGALISLALSIRPVRQGATFT